MLFTTPQINLTVASNVVAIWLSYRQNRFWKKEACGVLIGSSNKSEYEVSVELVTPPMRGDFRNRLGFRLLDKHHQNTVDREWEKSSGGRFYLGYWHTHPQPNPMPSGLDLAEWRNNYNQNKQHMKSLFYPIIGTSVISIWQVSNSQIIQMHACTYEYT